MMKLQTLVFVTLLTFGLFAIQISPVQADSIELPPTSGEHGVQAVPTDDQSPTSISLSQVEMEVTQTFLPLWLILSLLLSIATLVAFHAEGSKRPQPVYSLSRARWRLITWRFRVRQRWGRQLL